MKAKNERHKVNCWVNNNVNITTYQNEGLIKNPVFILCDGNEPLDLSDCTNIFYKSVDTKGKVSCVSVNILSANKGEVELPINGALTENKGVSVGEIVVQTNEGTLSFGNINIITYSSVENKEIEKSDNFTALTEALSKVAILTPEGTVAMDTELNKTSVNPLTNKAVTEAITTLRNTKIDTVTATQEIAKAKSEAISVADSMLDEYDKTYVQPTLNKKADKADTLAGYGITDAYNKTYLDKALKNKLDARSFDTVPAANSPNYVTSGTVYNSVNTLNQSINKKADKQDVTDMTKKVQCLYNLSPTESMIVDTKTTARAMCVYNDYLYHSGNSKFAISKIDIRNEAVPQNLSTLGGHSGYYPRGISIGNGHLYAAYRENASGLQTSANTVYGGYLDIINLSNNNISTINYGKKPYTVTVTVGGQEVEKTLYFGKSHYTATYNDSLLCVTQQMGGWLLYDISSNPQSPELLYEYDCRARAYDSDRTGYEEYQQPAFLSDGDKIFLAIAGYDRDLVRIYDVTVPKTPTLIYECNLRKLWNGNPKDECLHTMGISCLYPYIYCTIAPYPGRILSETMTGVATVDISDLNKITVSLSKMPNADRTENASGEPAPASIAICDDYIIMDNYDKGISVWDISDKSNPVYIKTIETDTKTCSVVADSGRIFCGSTYESNKIKMYRFKKENALTGIIASVKNFDVQKADKADTLAGYGITDAYNKTYLDKALKNKLDARSFDTVPAANSPNYVTSGTVYNSVNSLRQTVVQNKADIEKSLAGKYDAANNEIGSGELSPTQTIYEGSEGNFVYAKNGDAVTVSVNITSMLADKNYLQMSGLPFPSKTESKLASIAVYSTANKLRNVRIVGSWIYISSPSDNFAEGEKMNFIITYIIRR